MKEFDTPLFESIADFLSEEGFDRTDTEVGITFSKNFEVPGRTMIVNGTRLTERPHIIQFPIYAIGSGRIFTNTENDGDELQGFKIGNTDIWVDSLKDFQFWYSKVFEH